jgi:TRAP-type mannitol/chloroaromatic compound transport system permease small subunit
MEKTLRQAADILDVVNEKIGGAVSWLTALLVLTVFANVVLRYAFSNNQQWLGELSWHIFSLIFLLAAGYTLKHNKHVRVDVFYARLTERKRAFIDLLGSVLFLIPVCLMIIFSGWDFAIRSFQMGERSPEGNGLPALYLIKFAIVFGFVFLLIQAVAFTLRSLHTFLYPNASTAV